MLYYVVEYYVIPRLNYTIIFVLFESRYELYRVYPLRLLFIGYTEDNTGCPFLFFRLNQNFHRHLNYKTRDGKDISFFFFKCSIKLSYRWILKKNDVFPLKVIEHFNGDTKESHWVDLLLLVRYIDIEIAECTEITTPRWPALSLFHSQTHACGLRRSVR